MAKHTSLAKPSTTQKQLVREQESEVTFKNPQLSVATSQEFLKKLSVVAVSCIAYLRNIFPADAFQEKKFDGHKVYILKATDDVPDTKTFINWIKNAFDLVCTHQLKKIVLVVQNGIVTLETYSFSFTYNHDEIHCDILGEMDGKEVIREQSQGLPADIAKSVRQLIRSILVHTSTLDPLPNSSRVSVKLIVNDNIPEDILPEGFMLSPADDLLNFPTEAETFKLGKVESKFTTFAVSTKSVLTEGNYMYPDAQQEENIVSSEEVEDVVPCSQSESNQIRSLPSMTQLDRSRSLENKEAEHDSSTTNLSEKLSVVSLRENIVSCICECDGLIGGTIKCISCGKFQHKTCYKFLERHQVEAHVCVECHNPTQGRICSNPELLNDANRKESALYRQALVFCCNSPHVSCQKIMTHLKVPRRVAEQLFKKLDDDGCFHPATNKGHIRKVKLDVQESILSRYFTAPTVSDSMHMETQHSSNDPSYENRSLKRQLDEEKENVPPPGYLTEPKRRKVLNPFSKVKKTLFSRD